MTSPKVSNAGFLEFIPKSGKPFVEYCLKVGANKIGTSITEDIRIKSKNPNLKPVSCVINVKNNGLATLENKCKQAILLNGSKMNKVQMLKNNDKFVIADKMFRYVNKNLPKAVTESIKMEKRQSVMPNFKLNTVSRIPLSTRKNPLRRSFSATKTMKDISRRSCSSALPDRKRNRVFQWETIATPSNRKLLTPSTSMDKSNDLSLAVRKSLFLKNKGDISFHNSKKSITSVLTLQDSICSVVKSAEKSSRGLKRGRSSSCVENSSKRRKHSSDHFLFLSISGCESVFEDSSSSTESQESLLTCSASCTKVQKSPRNDLTDVRGVKNFLRTPKSQKSPINDLTNVRGVKKLMRTPKEQKSPLNDLTDVRGVKKILRTPRGQKSPLNDLSNVGGVKKLLKTPKVQKSPLNDLTDLKGVKKFLRTPRQPKSPLNDLTNVGGVKKLMKTPKVQKSPLNDLTDIRGVKKFLRTPKEPKSPTNDLSNVSGLKKLLRTPKEPKSPTNDLSNVSGLKKLLRTPKELKSPLNDLSNVGGIKKFLTTPKEPKSPVNDLTEITGVKKLFKTPKVPKSPSNDLSNFSGIGNILTTPTEHTLPVKDTGNMSGVKKTRYFKKSPKNDLSDVRGVKKLLRTPKVHKQPKNDLTDLEGVKELMTLNTSLENLYPEHLHDPKIFNSTVLTPNMKMKASDDEVLQLSQRGRRIRKKQLEDDFVGSPILVGARGGTRSRRQKNVDEQNSVISISTTPNLENSPAKQIPHQNQNARGRPKKSTMEDVTNMEEGSPNVTKSVQVLRRGGRGRKKNTNDEVHEESTKEETSVKRSTRGRKNRDMVEESKEVPNTPRGRRGKIEEFSIPEEENEVLNRERGRGRTPKIEEIQIVKRTRGRKGKVVEETSEVVNNDNEEKRGRGRRKKVGEALKVMEDRHGKKAKVEEETSEKVQNGTEEKRRRGRRRKVEEKPEMVEDSQEIEVKEKKQASGGKGNIKEDEVPKTKSKKKVPEEDIIDVLKKTQGEKRKNDEEILKNETQIDENKEIIPVKTRKGRNVKKVQTGGDAENSANENVQRIHNTRGRAKKLG